MPSRQHVYQGGLVPHGVSYLQPRNVVTILRGIVDSHVRGSWPNRIPVRILGVHVSRFLLTSLSSRTAILKGTLGSEV